MQQEAGVPVAFPEKTMDDYLRHGVDELVMKRFMANVCIQAAEEALEEDNDPRAPRAIAYYREQRRLINQAIYAHRYGEEGPPDQTIAVKPATFGSKARGKSADLLTDILAHIGDEQWLREMAKSIEVSKKM